MNPYKFKQGIKIFFELKERPEELGQVVFEANFKNRLVGEQLKEDIDNVFIVNDSGIFGIQPKNELMRKFLNTIMDEGTTKKIKVNFHNLDGNTEEIFSYFGMEYLTAITKMCDGYEIFKLSLRRDYPLRIETDDFICILAPRDSKCFDTFEAKNLDELHKTNEETIK